MAFSLRDRELMARAINLAKKGLNTTTPNPRVGCVIANENGDILGEGFHEKAGEAHAEIYAIQNAGAAVKGATAYVSLEPCSHTGKTGPCAQALIEAGVARVVYGMEDPNPKVAGRGLDQLIEAGIQVDGPLMEDEARELNPGFIKRMQQGMPWLRVKMAMSVDGRTAMESGESKWVTGPDARADVQNWRARSCALVTGVESVVLDDPSMTVRLSENDRQPLRIILDSTGRCPETAEILEQPGKTIIATCSDTVANKNEDSWLLPSRDGRVDLYALVRKLAEQECNEVLIETGATLAGAFVAAGLVDELVIYMAPKLLGSDARPLFSLPINKMSGQLPLIIQDIRAIGADWRILARPDPVG